jgi:adenylate kinase family enzyme/GNAT superfamily N-acetyltransferase
VEAFRRSLIIGNSGTGKSTLAEKIASHIGGSAIDLDMFHWEPTSGYGKKRDEAVARQMVLEAAAERRWVIEGVYGWLAEVAISRATALIWLDMPWSVCEAGLRGRGKRRGGTDADMEALLHWAGAYWKRDTSSSFKGHMVLFEKFTGPKYRLRGRADIDQFFATQVRETRCRSTGSNYQLTSISALDARLAPLNEQAIREGFQFVARLVNDWASGSNTFSEPGERLVGAFRDDELLGICGLNRDPYAAQSGVGRLRHLYVKKAERQRGIGFALVGNFLEEARGIFRIIRLRTDTPEAAIFYERLGFRRTLEENATHVWTL